MKIIEVERLTGLSQKAIRLYEGKGLIKVLRDSNGYRNYTEKDIEALKSIKLFRSIGISITDIRLYISGVISLEELIDKRKSQILKDSGRGSEQYIICESIIKMGGEDVVGSKCDFTENEDDNTAARGSLSVGIDIGTTTISAVVIDIDSRERVETFSLPHNLYIRSDIYSEQNANEIINKAKKLLYHILDRYNNVVSIGVTGQMHGIVYINENGEAVSNLINWQDKRADQPLSDGISTCEHIRRITGDSIATGYGIATHYYNIANGIVPYDAVSFCSIMDLFIINICGLKRVRTHTSIAASFGLFDVKSSCFKKEKLSLIGIDNSFLPAVTDKNDIVGKCKNIPVSVAIGDNQASFLGSIKENSTSALVNIGTGSQISVISEYCDHDDELELRPFIDGKYLMCGSALCGGRSYSMLESFFRSYTVSAGMSESSQYRIMNDLARRTYDKGEVGLTVEPFFYGKRSDPTLRGTIKMIDHNNFTPEGLILGILKGMCSELYEMYKKIPEKREFIIASGGAARRIDVMKNLICDEFELPTYVNMTEEEASVGVALYSAFAIGKINYNNGFFEYISYSK